MTMQIAIGLYEGFAALDAIGPYQVLTSLPGAEVLFCAERTGIVADEDRMLRVDVTRTFADTPRPDLLLVPGGLNTRLLAKDGVPIVEWIKAAHPHTTYTTSVCTGALLLGAAGLLRGLPATTHWLAYDHLRAFGAEPTEQRVVIQGKIATAAGVSAGIDLGLTLAAEIAPVLLFGVPSGKVAARLGAKRTLQFTQLLAAPLVAAIPVLHYAGALTFPILLDQDGAVGRRYLLRALPSTFFIDRQGVIRTVVFGGPLSVATIETIRRAGGAVLAVEAERTILLDAPETIALAERHGISVVAR